MHRSRGHALVIDARESTAAEAADFRAAALGATARPFPPAPQFTTHHRALPGLVAAVQAVDDTPRTHLDVETDDVVAETARLTALGAEEVSRWQERRVLRAPGGHLLRVLPVESDAGAFRAQGRVWP
ncbi:hypothetical protein RVR_376 [Actinacidiphila reveromycinica]|uniref:Glyoxalase-like domain-containing protein n=1 Tax=Actinacidiphila reveromycinica TaxID=659352 RepID=A0A7U3UMX8_9ACTN|nr:VOC family protein [Streptomyces sp. SN-593]BBA95493.1 hypothetical protein RVR_376 [Streptomyces sp. SN-593]